MNDLISQSTFAELVGLADNQFNQSEYAIAKDSYIRAVLENPADPGVFYAIERSEQCDEIINGKEWYGERTPTHITVNILGSVSTDGKNVYTHRVRTGLAAYQCDHISVYLEDLLRCRQFPGVLQPSFALLYLSMLASDARDVELSEIGASLYSAFEKISNARSFINTKMPQAIEVNIKHICIEMSDQLRFLAGALHQGEDVSLYKMWKSVPAPQAPRFSFSLGVGNYAFSSSDEFVVWLSQNHVAVIRERFTIGQDIVHHIMGKRFTIFDLNAISAALIDLGYGLIYSIDEASAFMDEEGALPGNEIIFNAHVFIHRLSSTAVERIAEWLHVCNADNLPGFGDSSPPAVVHCDVLREAKSLDKLISEISWKREYVRKKSTTVCGPQQGMTLSFPDVFTGIINQIDNFDRIYGSSLKKKFSESICDVMSSQLPVKFEPCASMLANMWFLPEGFWIDGWTAGHCEVSLAGGPSATLHISAMSPKIGNDSRVICIVVSINDKIIANNSYAPGNIDMAIGICESTGARRIKIDITPTRQLLPPDTRIIGIMLNNINIGSSCVSGC